MKPIAAPLAPRQEQGYQPLLVSEKDSAGANATGDRFVANQSRADG